MGRDERDAIRQSYIGEEDGHIYFFYRPLKSDVQQLRDIEQLYIVLHPLASKKYRLISLDTSALPPPEAPFNLVTATVEKVDRKPQPLMHQLGEKLVDVQGVALSGKYASRPCGEGLYSLIPRYNGVHLFYVLELPQEETEVISQLGIGMEGEFLTGVYNPYYGTDPEEIKPEVTPSLPEPMKNVLRNERIFFKDIHLFLDFEKIKLALFRESPQSETGEELHPIKKSIRSADIFSDLRINRERFPVNSLITGRWE